MKDVTKLVCDCIETMGWKMEREDSNVLDGMFAFVKDDNICIDVSGSGDNVEIVLIGDQGDFRHFRGEDEDVVYVLLGYLFVHRYISLSDMGKCSKILL